MASLERMASGFESNPEGFPELLENILQSSTEYSIIAKDLDGTIILWNEGARRIYGYSPEEVVGKLKGDVLHLPEDVESGRARQIMDTVLKTGKYEGVWRRRRKDGGTFTARLVMTLRRDALGKPIGFLIMSKDITGEEQLNQRLIESQEYTRSLIEASLDPLVTISTDGKITDVNQATERVTGVPRAKLIGTDFADYFTEPEKARVGFADPRAVTKALRATQVDTSTARKRREYRLSPPENRPNCARG